MNQHELLINMIATLNKNCLAYTTSHLKDPIRQATLRRLGLDGTPDTESMSALPIINQMINTTGYKIEAIRVPQTIAPTGGTILAFTLTRTPNHSTPKMDN